MKRLALMALFFVAGCGSIGAAQAHSISLAYKPGDTYKYGLHMVLKYTVAAQGMSLPIDLDLSAKETVTVKSVNSSGTADLTVELANLTLKTSMNGTTNTTTTTAPKDVDVTIASDGRIVSVNGNALGTGSLPGMTGQGGIVSAILPDKPVKPGDTWSKTYSEPNPLGSGTDQVTSDNKYLRDETVGGASTSVVESKIKSTLDLSIDASSLAGGSGMPGLPSTGAASPGGDTGMGVKGISIKGTTSTDATSWIDINAKRIAKSHATSSVDAILTVTMAPGSTTPGLTGPVTIKGTQTMDLNPA